MGIFSSFQKSEYIDKYELNKPVWPLTTASYVLSKTGVTRLLRIINDKIHYHIDFLIAKENFFYNLNYYALKNINVLNVSYTSDSNLISKNNGILNYIIDKCGLEKLNWLLSNNACCLFLKYSISVYTLILILFIVIYMFFFIPTPPYDIIDPLSVLVLSRGLILYDIPPKYNDFDILTPPNVTIDPVIVLEASNVFIAYAIPPIYMFLCTPIPP